VAAGSAKGVEVLYIDGGANKAALRENDAEGRLSSTANCMFHTESTESTEELQQPGSHGDAEDAEN
jgi:hypothetical protein